MPSPSFFRHAGLFLIPNFLEASYLADLCTSMAAAPCEKAEVERADGSSVVDEAARKVESTLIPKETRRDLKQRLLSLKPRLEAHFNVTLGGCESPDFLIYGPTDFFTPHADGGGSSGHSEGTRRRRVSAVIFLNRESADPEDGTYGEGRLKFYGLLDGAHWDKCAFSLDPEPGLLIAFPSQMVHEVTPVSHGRRFTIVTWFFAPENETISEPARPEG